MAGEVGLSGSALAAAVAQIAPKVEQMRANPRADWTIADIKQAAQQLGLRFKKPTRGSHFKVSSNLLQGILPIPARRPIRAVYIKQFVSLAEAHVAALQEEAKR